MLRSHLDHLVVAAPALDAGDAYVQRLLGVAAQPGGEHARMGTHNRLLHLGERVYLEVIAIDPEGRPPGRPRWFQLDDPDATHAPRLATWIVRTSDIHAAVARSPISLGSVESMTRGDLEWLITVPEDGRLRMGGVAPTLIQWPDGVHPTQKLEDRGCRLLELRGLHPEAQKIAALLDAIGFEGNVRIGPLPASHATPLLAAQIQTPFGSRRLGAD